MNQHHKGIPEKNNKLISVDTIKNIMILINNHALFINFFDNQKLVKSRSLKVNIHHGQLVEIASNLQFIKWRYILEFSP